ncbi:acyl carrier protein, partial [Myxococcota bacterium]
QRTRPGFRGPAPSPTVPRGVDTINKRARAGMNNRPFGVVQAWWYAIPMAKFGKEDIQRQLHTFVENKLAPGCGPLEGDQPLDEGLIHSMDVLLLIEFVEERFAFPVGQKDVKPENFKTLDNLTEFVLTKIDC